MRKLLIFIALLGLLVAPASGGVKKFNVPLAATTTTAPGTATYQTVYVCDALTDLVAITGQSGDVGIVVGYGSGQVFLWNSAFWLPADSTNPAVISIAQEFTAGTGVSAPDFRDFNTSGSISMAIDDPGGHPGIVSLSTASSSSANAAMSIEQASLQLGNGAAYYEADVRIPTLSVGAQRFQVSVGFRDAWSTLDATDGCYWRYKDDVNGGEWEGVCYSNSSVSSTLVDSNVPVVAGTWYKLGVLVNAAGTSATFYLNGAAVGSAITTSIPTGAGRETGAGAGIKKTVGTTARTVECDYEKLQITLTTAR